MDTSFLHVHKIWFSSQHSLFIAMTFYCSYWMTGDNTVKYSKRRVNITPVDRSSSVIFGGQ